MQTTFISIIRSSVNKKIFILIELCPNKIGFFRDVLASQSKYKIRFFQIFINYDPSTELAQK